MDSQLQLKISEIASEVAAHYLSSSETPGSESQSLNASAVSPRFTIVRLLIQNSEVTVCATIILKRVFIFRSVSLTEVLVIRALCISVRFKMGRDVSI